MSLSVLLLKLCVAAILGQFHFEKEIFDLSGTYLAK